MDRDILYRAKRADNGEWIEGLPGYDINGNITEFKDYKGFSDCEIIEVDPKTVCQYTGLTDKSGRKIFEGDIVKNEYAYIGIAEWECCSFVLDWISWNASRDLYVWSNSVEVIGNIFDNPELLEVEP